MKKIEFHILQSFAPSNLNRDDTGSPKDALFGGVRRGRISSQSLKRAARLFMRDSGLLPAASASVRTKRLVELIGKQLVERGVEPDVGQAAAANILNGVGSQGKMKVKPSRSGNEVLTEYLLFIGESEVQRIADIIAEEPEEYANAKSKKLGDAAKKVTDVLKEKGAGAVDVALFGRMLANLPEANTDASCQVAHAISTHRVDRDFDYYTAVDDRKPDDNSGADMIGTVEFNSSCYYRYSVIDVDQLSHNLGADSSLLGDTVGTYTRAVVEAIPSGKQNSFAAHNLPSTILVTVRRSQGPRNLANAFERPVPASGEGIIANSVASLAETWDKTDSIYGAADEAFVLDSTDTFPSSSATKVGSLEELVEAVRKAAG